MQYLEDMKKATVAEFDAAEADWRETVERQYEYLSECEDTPTPEMLDGEDLDDAIGIIDNYLQSVQERANDWEIDAEEWGKVAKARIEAHAKEAKRKAKAKKKAA